MFKGVLCEPLRRAVISDRSTLFSSPLSMADFVLRLAFFALAPVAIVFAAELFPVRGVIIDVSLALGLFIAGEAVQTWAKRTRLVRSLLSEALAFEAYYRSCPPRPFLYYLAYPLLFPYWLLNRDARREFLLFRGYTLGGLGILLVTLGWQYTTAWAPELGLRVYVPYVLLTLLVETILALAILMPVATTVVWYHSSFRRGRLAVVLSVGLISTTLVFIRLANRRRPIVSFATRERVVLRTQASKRKAHRALLQAVRAARQHIPNDAIEGDGLVLGAPLDKAVETLQQFYKRDEAYSFNLWASPRRNPKVLVLYFEARRQRRPIWVAIGSDGAEIRTPSHLPRGAFNAMRAATQTDDALMEMWPDAFELSVPESVPTAGRARVKPGTHRGSPGTSAVTPHPEAVHDAGDEPQPEPKEPRPDAG
jgi:hypothetical protein